MVPEVASPAPRPARRWRRVAWIIAAQVALVALAERWCRGLVGAHGVTPFQVSADPDLAFELRPSFSTTYAGVAVRTNSLGFRGDEPPTKRPGVRRIALVGDSYVFGSGVAEEETLGAVVARSLDEAGVACDVLAFGVPGYTAKDIARLLETRVLQQEPDVVVYVNFGNDMEVVPKSTSIPPDAEIDVLADFRLRSALIEYCVLLVRRAGWRFGVHIGGEDRAALAASYRGAGGQRLKAAITRMRTSCQEAGAQFVIAVYPHLSYMPLSPLRAADELLLAEAPELGVSAIDLLPAFGDEADLTHHWVTPFDSHPDARGHELAGARLAQELLRLGVLTP